MNTTKLHSVIPYVQCKEGTFVLLCVNKGVIKPLTFDTTIVEGYVHPFHQRMGAAISQALGSELFKEPRYTEVDVFHTNEVNWTIVSFSFTSKMFMNLLAVKYLMQKERHFCDALIMLPVEVALECVEDKWVIESFMESVK